MTIPTIDIDSWGETFTCRPEVSAYAGGRLAINLLYWDSEMQGWFPHCRLTTNLPDQHLNEGEVFVKDWSENEPIVDALLKAGWLSPTGREVISGFIAPQVMRPAGPLLDFIQG